jgi:hypothetical protein
MKLIKWIFAFVVLGGVLAYFLRSPVQDGLRETPQVFPEQTPEPSSEPSPEQSGGQQQDQRGQKDAGPPSAQNTGILPNPDIAEIKKEFADDPHSVPESLVTYSKKVGARMDEARADAAAAFRLARDLATTIQKTESKILQAYCVSVMVDLGKSHPQDGELAHLIQETRSKLPPDTLQLSERNSARSE